MHLCVLTSQMCLVHFVLLKNDPSEALLRHLGIPVYVFVYVEAVLCLIYSSDNDDSWLSDAGL